MDDDIVIVTHKNSENCIKDGATSLDEAMIEIVSFSQIVFTNLYIKEPSFSKENPLLILTTLITNIGVTLIHEACIKAIVTPCERIKFVDGLGSKLHAAINKAWGVIEALQVGEGEQN